MSTIIVDYGSGNLHSAKKAFECASARLDRPHAVTLATDPAQVRSAERIVLPGVGVFADCLAGIQQIPGMLEALHEAVILRGRPFIGICVGMQLLATRGLEYGSTAGLNWIEGEVRPLTPADPQLKIPHMGWNTLTLRRTHPVLRDLPCGETQVHAYFVHSFQFVPIHERMVLAETHYGEPVTAMVSKDNMIGAQFHPEKSQKFGLSLIENFLKWRP